MENKSDLSITVYCKAIKYLNFPENYIKILMKILYIWDYDPLIPENTINQIKNLQQ